MTALDAREVRVTGLRCVALSHLYDRDEQWFTLGFRAIKADAAIVVTETDAGLVGVGEACAYGHPALIAEHVAWLARLVVGGSIDDAFRFARPTGGAWSVDCAVAGLDCALWDLRGQLAERPVAALLGADARAAVDVYASGGCRYDWRARPEALVEEVVGHADAGHRAAKVRLGTDWAWDAVTPARFLALLAEVVDAVGDRLRVMVDANQRLDFEDALTVARGLDRLGIDWFEEPLPQDDIDGYARLRRAVDVRITGGERLTTVAQFRPYLERGALAVVQPDAGWCGISEALAIADAAADHGVGFAPHSWHNGLMALANAALVAAVPTALVLELSTVQGPLFGAVLDRDLELGDGRLRLPDRPGLGAALPSGVEERHPYVEGYFAVTVHR